MGWPGQASEHETDHGETDEGGDGSGVTLEIACQSAISTEPGEGALDDPAFGNDDEAMQFAALDDLQGPGSGLGDGRGCLRPLIAGIGEDALDEGEEAARAPVEDERRTVAVLHVGGVDDDVHQEAERVDEDVALTSRRLLARVVARGVDRGPPFEAPRAVWLSMIAAVGLASRPARSREAT